MSGWNLPPGVTDRMIDEAAGAFDDDHSDIEEEAEPVEAPPLPFWTLAIYLVDKAYGGPEEGGWWYEHGTRQDHPLEGVAPMFVLKVWSNEEAADAACSYLQKLLNETVNVGRPEIDSVLSTGRYYAEVHNGHPPAYWPEKRPHYE